MKFYLVFVTITCLLLSCKNDRNDNPSAAAIDQSLINSNNFIAAQTRAMSLNLKNRCESIHYTRFATTWYPMDTSIQRLTRKLTNHIDSLRTRIETKEKELTGADIHDLYQQLSTCSDQLAETCSPENSRLDSTVRDDLKMVHLNVRAMPLNRSLAIDASNNSGRMTEQEWFQKLFGGTSTIEYLSALDKIKNDILLTENRLADLCYTMTNTIWHRYEEGHAMIWQNSTMVKKGEALEISAGIGMFSLESISKVYFDDIESPIGMSGLARYKTTVNGHPGKHHVMVRLTFYHPDGSLATFTKDIDYTVVP